MATTALQIPAGLVTSFRIRYINSQYVAESTTSEMDVIVGTRREGYTADVDGDGFDECFIKSQSPSFPSFIVNCDPREAISIIQEIEEADIGYELATLGLTAELRDENSDGRADMLLRLEGRVVTVLIARPDGTFTIDDPEGDDGGVAAAVRNLWGDFRDRVNAGSAVTAASLSRLDSVQRYETALSDLGADLATIDDTWSALTAVSITPTYAEYALRQTVNGTTSVFLVTFVKQDDGTWAIGNL